MFSVATCVTRLSLVETVAMALYDVLKPPLFVWRGRGRLREWGARLIYCHGVVNVFLSFTTGSEKKKTNDLFAMLTKV